jgi:hypothetical protein
MDWDDRVTDRRRPGAGVKQVAIVLSIVFAATLAVVVGKEMSADAMAVVVGVVCGVAAGLPTSLLLLVALTRKDHTRGERMAREGQGSFPPVVVVQGGGAGQGLPQGPQAGYWPAPMPEPSRDRQFQVVGGDDLLLDERRY